MISCSSSKAAEACCSLKTSKSDFPTSSSALRPGVYAAIQPSLTSKNRLSLSLKYTRSWLVDSRLDMQVSSRLRGSLSRGSSGRGLAVTIATPPAVPQSVYFKTFHA